MKVLLLSPNYAPELTGVGRYSGEMAAWLAARGHEVRVVCAAPHYPAWRVAEGYSGAVYRAELVDGARVLRCPLYVPARPTGLRRLLHLLSFALTSLLPTLWIALRRRPDVVLVVEPPLACAPAALLAARLSGAAAWLHVQDLEVDAAFELGVLRASWARRALLSTERWLLSRFDRVSSISGQMLERLQEKGVPSQRLKAFPNWTDLAQIRPLTEPSSLRQEWGIAEDNIVLLYSGSLGAKQGLELLVEVVRLLPESTKVILVICGEGPAKATLQALVGDSSRFRFLPLQPMERLNALLNAADIHLLPQRAGAEGLVMPSKLAGMMASGKPVIACASDGTDVAWVVAGCGEVVAPGNAVGFAAAVEKLASAPALRQEYGARGRERAAAIWDRDHILAEVFESGPLLPSRAPAAEGSSAASGDRGPDPA